MGIKMAKVCNYPGCGNYVFSKGFCKWHQPPAKPIAVRKPLQRSGKRIAPISEKMASNLAKYRKRRDKYFDEHPICEFPGCNSRQITLHHKRGRVGSFLTDKRYFCSLCQKHHQWVNENNKEAAKMGLVESRLGK